MEYIRKLKAEKIVTNIELGVYPEFMISELALANGANSRTEAEEIEKEVKKQLKQKQ